MRIRDAAATMRRAGSTEGLWSYLERIGDEQTASLSAFKHDLAERLSAAEESPQIVSVQGRGNRAGGAYLIVPLAMGADLLDALQEEQEFTPITQKLRMIGDNIDLEGFDLKASGWRRRQKRIK